MSIHVRYGSIKGMDISLLSTIDDIEKLRNLALAMVQNAVAENAEKEKLLQQNSDLLQRILLLEEMLKLARQQRFGKKGETLAGMQRSLFEGDVDADIAAVKRSWIPCFLRRTPFSQSIRCVNPFRRTFHVKTSLSRLHQPKTVQTPTAPVHCTTSAMK